MLPPSPAPLPVQLRSLPSLKANDLEHGFSAYFYNYGISAFGRQQNSRDGSSDYKQVTCKRVSSNQDPMVMSAAASDHRQHCVKQSAISSSLWHKLKSRAIELFSRPLASRGNLNSILSARASSIRNKEQWNQGTDEYLQLRGLRVAVGIASGGWWAATQDAQIKQGLMCCWKFLVESSLPLHGVALHRNIVIMSANTLVVLLHCCTSGMP